MNNALLRTFVIYAVCVVLAIWLGFLLAGPLTYSAVTIFGLLGFTLVFPLLLRWHYPLMLLCWNFSAGVFLLPGSPSVGLVMIFLSLGISVLQRMISSQSRFISVAWMTLPLVAIIAVAAFTAKMTGFGVRSLGGNVYGGHKYAYLIGGILGYFALSAQKIPPGRRNLYLALYFLGGLSWATEDIVAFLPHSFYFIYWFFKYNPDLLRPEGVQEHVTRWHGAMMTSVAIFSFMMARYGIRGLFLSRKPWRWMFLMLAVAWGLLGGYRGMIASVALIFLIQFFLEGLQRTKLLAIFLSAGTLGALAMIPLMTHLPMELQRSMSFLPFHVSTEARLDAQATLTWRLNMWQALLPQIPHYLLLGKGYNINPLDYEFVMGPEAAIHSTAENDPLALAEDFHNGPISVLIPFGIWGAIVILWFAIAALRVLYLNFHYGDPDLITVNSFLLAAFATHLIMFLFIGGDLSADMMGFCGVFGLSVAFNGGVRQPAHVVQPARNRDQLRRQPSTPDATVPAFQRRPDPSR